MKRYFILYFFCLICASSYGQNAPVRTVLRKGAPQFSGKDTTKVVYDEQGNKLLYSQYQKLINSGEYGTKWMGDPSDSSRKLVLRKLSIEERNKRYKIMKNNQVMKSSLLQEGMELDLSPLENAVSLKRLEDKVVVLVFFVPTKSGTNGFDDLNNLLLELNNPEDLVILAITLSDPAVVRAVLKKTPLHYTKLITEARSICDAYELSLYPAYVLADKKKIIRHAVNGSSGMTVPALNLAIRSVLNR